MSTSNRTRWPWYGLVFGAVLFVFAYVSAGYGHGTYLPFAVFGAPLSFIPDLGLFIAAPVLWGLVGWQVRNPRRWIRITTMSVHTVAVGLVLLIGIPQEPGPDQWRYFWHAERLIGWWLWSGMAAYALGLIVAWVLALSTTSHLEPSN